MENNNLWLRTIRAIPRFSKASRFSKGKSASSPNARANRETEPSAIWALCRMASCAVTPIVASPSVRKMIMGTRRGDDKWLSVDEELISCAAERRAALMFVPGEKEMQKEKDGLYI